MAGNSIRKQTTRSRTTNTQLNRLTLSLEALRVGLNDPGPSIGPSNSSGTACSITVKNKDSSLILNIQTESSDNQRNSSHHAQRGQHAAGRNRCQQAANQRPPLNRVAPDRQTIDSFRGQAQSSDNQRNSSHHAQRGQHAAGRNRCQQAANQRPPLNRVAPDRQTIDSFRGQAQSSDNQRNSSHHAQRGQHAAGRNRCQQAANQRPPLNRVAPDRQTIDSFRGQAQRYQQPAPIARTSRGHSNSCSARPKTDNELNCPTCKIPFGSLQIYQCGRGHGSCYACMKYGKPCGICRSEIIPMRNFAVEEYFSKKLGRCPHSIYGCNHTTKLAQMHEHVKECVFGPLKCPFHDCYYEMPLIELVSHSDVWHPGHLTNIGSELKIIHPFTASQNVYLVQIGDSYFVFRVLVSTEDSRIFMAAQLIGSKVDASKWMYEIHVYNKNECRRKFTSSDVCISFADTVIERQGKCCTLTCLYASTFVHNGVLTYKFFINKIV